MAVENVSIYPRDVLHFPQHLLEIRRKLEIKDLDNLSEAVNELEITYPVAQDNNTETWWAYQTRCWPTLYLID